MAFTYDPVVTPRDVVRFELGDTDSSRALFTDEEIDAKLAARGGEPLATAADLCDILATRFARDYDFEWQAAGSGARGKFNRSQMAKAYAERATALRARVGGGLSTIQVTRVDGYSDSLSSRDGAGGTGPGGRTLRGWYGEDVPA